MRRAERNQPAFSNQSSASSSDYHSSAFESVSRTLITDAEHSTDHHTAVISLRADNAAPIITPANQIKPAGTRTTRISKRTARTEDTSDTSKPSLQRQAKTHRTTPVNRPSSRKVRLKPADKMDQSEQINRNERTLTTGNRPQVVRRFLTIETQRARNFRQDENPNCSVARAGHI